MALATGQDDAYHIAVGTAAAVRVQRLSYDNCRKPDEECSYFQHEG
jgi:hypothetical protein